MPHAPDRESVAPAASYAMRLLANESSGAILRSLAEGPLRSTHLTERLPHYSARTVYRRLNELAELGAVVQRSLPTSPPTVTYELTPAAGRDLLGLLDEVASTWLTHWDDGLVGSPPWALLALLADGWDSAIIHEVSKQARSLTELDVAGELTYHQMSRRTARLAGADILERVEEGRFTRYALSERARLASLVIAASANWERKHLSREGGSPSVAPLRPGDVAALLRSALPLARLPECAGCEFVVTVEADRSGGDSERFASVRGTVGPDGAVRCLERGDVAPDAWVRGSIDAWLCLLIENDCSRLRVGGDRAIIEAHFERLAERATLMTRVAR